MNQLEDFRSFLLKERQAQQADERVDSVLSRQALVERGEALNGLVMVKKTKTSIVLQCDSTNESRLRAGSQVQLENGKSTIQGTVREIEAGGDLLAIDITRDGRKLNTGPWFMRESTFDLTPVLIECLNALQPGAPGWSFHRIMSGKVSNIPQLLREAERSQAESTLDTLLQEVELDESQQISARQCLQLPVVLGVQGPPGTGKTRVLAVVAEALCRLGKRVVVVAPTHQAVNNALSTVHHQFPTRSVIKIGSSLQRESLAPDIRCVVLREIGDSIPQDEIRQTIIGMTAMSAICQFALKTSGLAPNVLLVDEASQLPYVQATCLGLIGAGSIQLFGDDAQMPPIFHSEVEDNPLATSVFAQLRDVSADSISLLNTTHRMNSDLCSLISTTFYPTLPTPLRSSKTACDRRFAMIPSSAEDELVSKILGPQASVWIQTPAYDNRDFNIAEAEIASRVIEAALAGGIKTDEVAVVTPFRRQVAIIRRKLRERRSQIPIVDTVERVQGLTVELVLFSFCVSDPDYMSDVSRFLFSPNRLNVALSRARTKAVILGTDKLFDGIPTDFQGLRGQGMVHAVRENSLAIDATNQPAFTDVLL